MARVLESTRAIRNLVSLAIVLAAACSTKAGHDTLGDHETSVPRDAGIHSDTSSPGDIIPSDDGAASGGHEPAPIAGNVTFGFSPSIYSDCWSYNFKVGLPTSPWIGGNGSKCDLAQYAMPPRYTISVAVEDMTGMPFPTSGDSNYTKPYESWIAGFFSYERQDNLPAPRSQYRMHPNLFNFGFDPRPDLPGAYYFDSVLDKVNASGLSPDEIGTSLGTFLAEDFFSNNTATKGALPIPDLGPNAQGHGLHVGAAVQLHDSNLQSVTTLANYCKPGAWVGDSATGSCGQFLQKEIGPASARMVIGIGILAAGKTYWLDIGLWMSGPNLFAPYDAAANPQNFPNPELVLESGPNSSQFEQIYLDANQMTADKHLSASLPACPALADGVQNAAPGLAGDPWYKYDIDVTALVQCIPWTTPITDLAKAQVILASVGPVVNGAGRVYWAARDLLVYKPAN